MNIKFYFLILSLISNSCVFPMQENTDTYQAEDRPFFDKTKAQLEAALEKAQREFDASIGFIKYKGNDDAREAGMKAAAHKLQTARQALKKYNKAQANPKSCAIQ